MKIGEFEHGLELNKPTEGYVRTPGLHMSAIYNSLFEKLEPARFTKGDPDRVKMELGTAFEEVLEIALAERIFGSRPPEFAALPTGKVVPVGTSGSIIFSPDHLIFNGHVRLGEFKATWMSIRQGIQDKRFDKWFVQMKAYCYPLKITQARLYVLFVNGDYSYKPPHGGASIRAWDVEFSGRELVDNWAMLMRHAWKEGLLQ